MKRKIIILGVVIIVILAGTASFYFFYLGHPSRVALAKVNNEKITIKQFETELTKIEIPQRDMIREEPGELLEIMVINTILLQEAKKEGVSAPAKTFKDNAKDSKDADTPEMATIKELMKKKFPSPPEVSREEIAQFYSYFKDRMGGKPLDQVAPMIIQVIQEGKQQEAVGKYVGDLRKNAKVEIDQDRLKKIAAKPPESNTDAEFKKVLQSGSVALVDFGSNTCLPCRQMRPTLKDLSTQYNGKAGILVIDVYKYQDLAKEYKIQAIPTLVFFDTKGKEVFRFVGVLEKEKIVEKLKEIGMKI